MTEGFHGGFHAADLIIALGYQKRPPESEPQLRWIRARAFTHGCRDDNVQTMVDNLIEPLKLLAIKERLTS